MTDPRARLDQVDARTNATTDGPWTYGGQGWVFAPNPIPAHSGSVFDDLLATVTDDETGAFIAAARTDLPAATTALRAVLDLHIKVTRWMPYGDADVSYATPQEAKDWRRMWPREPAPLHLCAECARIEEGPTGENTLDVGYLGALWPCPTVTAITTALEDA